jgi:hypothetical protein
MNVDQLHQLHVNKLVKSFGVANTQEALMDDRAARAMGNHYSETADPATSKEEI